MKKILSATLILLCISSSVNASSIHGDFEGSPVVSVQSDGKELTVEDVPAINYKGRTMVPIYMLKQLGADVVWDNSSYSVNVNVNKDNQVNTNEDITKKETELIKDIYSWLSDTDMAMWMYAVKLQQYANSDTTMNQDFLTDVDYTALNDLYNESMKFSFEMMAKIKSDNKITDIVKSQSEALAQLGQTRDLLKISLNQTSDSQIKNNLKLSVLNSLKITQRNLNTTKRVLHESISKQYSN